ncbi:Stk1 family PASTA domain-containing Ser/Thr kinase [Anaerolentibacter hominis]|uniref:Stk1 family PASTA domain-containing Ser/Thr kinase n=1 Tax=Anaerolentibacter hominis TaxID=3079009 RepID=UPI0031B80499
MIQPGMFINNRYEIIEKVGSGGMADVYKAKDHRLNRFVAVKVLKNEFSSDKTFVVKFRAEAQAAAGLSHPNIVNVYDVGEDEGLYYIVMELIEGITLKEFIAAKGRLGVKEAVGIAIQIAQGLEVAHANHIIHRDIKPQNIILSKDGLAKVTDFGIAKAVSSNTITSNAVGSVHYISPEQARGGYSDEKSDIYSLGVTLYEMLSGKVPFVGESTVSVALQHIQEEPEAISQIDPSIPVSIDKIVQKCMQKKPERRYLNAADLIADLKYAIRNPEDDFVSVPPMINSDSPTLVISEEELNRIKSASGDGMSVRSSYEESRRNSEDERERRRKPVQEKPEPARSKKKKNDDLDDDGDIDPKLEKFMVAGGIAAVVILVLIIIFLVGKTIGIFNFGKDKNDDPNGDPGVEGPDTPGDEQDNQDEPEETPFALPNVVGATEDDARKTLEDLGLIFSPNEEASSEMEEGRVIRTEPGFNEQVKKGDTIQVYVSSGAEEVDIPMGLAGLTYDQVASQLTELGLNPKKNEVFDDNVEAGKVISVSPSEGTSIEKGKDVTVTVSKGKETEETLVPDLKNMTKSEANKALKDAKLEPGKVTEEFSADVEKGRVISQGTERNTKVEEGTKISYVLSKGPETTYIYVGSISVSAADNPFQSEEEEGTISVIVTQGGQTETVYESVLTYEDFEPTLNGLVIQGFQEGTGTVEIYLDGDLLIKKKVDFVKQEA